MTSKTDQKAKDETTFNDLVREYFKATKNGYMDWSPTSQDDDRYQSKAIQAPLKEEGKRVIIKKSQEGDRFLVRLKEEGEDPIDTAVLERSLSGNHHLIDQIWDLVHRE